MSESQEATGLSGIQGADELIHNMEGAGVVDEGADIPAPAEVSKIPEILGPQSGGDGPDPDQDPLKKYRIEAKDIGKTADELVQEVQTGKAPPMTREDAAFLDDYLVHNYAEHRFTLGRKVEVVLRSPLAEAQIQADRVMVGEDGLTTQIGLLRVTNIVLLAQYLYSYAGKVAYQEPEGAFSVQHFSREDSLKQRIQFVRLLDGNIIDRLIEELRQFQAKLSRLLRAEAWRDF